MRLLRAALRRSGEPGSFLIPAYAGLGNFIMATPMVLELRRRHPRARIGLLTWTSFGTDQLFAPGDGVIDEILLLDPAASLLEKVRFFCGLRPAGWHTALVPFDACPTFVWWGCALAGFPRVVAHTVETMGIPMGWTRAMIDASTPVDVAAHETDIHFDLLDACEGEKLPRSYATHVRALGPETLAKYGLTERGYIIVQLSASNAKFKTPKLWDRERFAEVIRKLNADGELVVLPGDENEKPLVDEFVARHGLPRVVNIAGRTSVAEVSTILKYAKLLLVHDSGLMHIGNAHGTPLIALYGPTDDGMTAPKAPTSRLLRKDLPCIPCMAKMAKTELEALRDCPIDIQCMKDLTAADVYRACREVLDLPPPLRCGFLGP